MILIVAAAMPRSTTKSPGKHLALKQECSLLMRCWSRQAMKLEEFAHLDWLMILRFILMYRRNGFRLFSPHAAAETPLLN